MSDLVNRLMAQAGAMRGRANRNPDVQGQLNQLAALLTEAANALQGAPAFEAEDCEHCGRVMYQRASAPGEREGR
jgi:hypothetical protein